jgi:hypothetical protein
LLIPQAAWYGILFYLLSLAFSKMAILLLYIHLFTFKWARLAGQLLFGLVVVTHLYMAAVTFTACIPLHSYWDFRVEKKYCHPQSVWWSNTGLHMGESEVVLLWPLDDRTRAGHADAWINSHGLSHLPPPHARRVDTQAPATAKADPLCRVWLRIPVSTLPSVPQYPFPSPRDTRPDRFDT